tara:strand:- start:671 stop:1102 length:432 start_codon:yes stop_codon:yes gene_type:complete
MKIFTIGFTKTSAENFFYRLKKAKVKRLVDTRLNNKSQLAGFAKGGDLEFFSKNLCGITYEHNLDLAPTKEILDAYRNKDIDWKKYERRYKALIKKRGIEELNQRNMSGACLLCSEEKPHNCHRRLIAEYLKKHWGKVEIVHL